MKLRDVIDLEAQWASDEGRDDNALRERDRALYVALAPAPRAADALLSAWLDALRAKTGAPALGERMAMAQRLVGYALVLSGLLIGWGVAEGLLHYEQGAAPVNVGNYLLVVVFGQLAALLALGAGLLLRRLWPAVPIVGDVARLLRFVALRVARTLRHAQPAVGEKLAAEWTELRRLQTRLGLYEQLERNLLLSQTQLFAVAFNLGVLASCLRLILLSDLAFAWSTSVASIDPAQLQRLCAGMAWPFAWAFPDAEPTHSLIAHTQYFRLEGRFAGASAGTRGDPQLAGQWWRFLVACTVCYGLAPRLFTLGLFWLRFRRAERDVPLDTPQVQRVLTRLVTPVLSTRGPEAREGAPEPARVVEQLARDFAGPTALVLYRDIPTAPAILTRAISDHLNLQSTSVHRAGGLDVHADQALCAKLGSEAGSVSVLAEAWEAPDKSLRALLAALRDALGPRRSLRVVLIGDADAAGFRAAAAEDVRVYRDRLTLLGDPYLLVDTLPAASEPASLLEHS